MTTAMTTPERLGRIETGQEGIKEAVSTLDRHINERLNNTNEQVNNTNNRIDSIDQKLTSIQSNLMQATIASLSTSVLILAAVITLKFI